ncbi:hypothetical protein H5410_031873 [Solanum commersonii]|uniref:Uncharacterized protein n=1 Tax=Solanum commersonii TaxID=4109 RepID=A0A9J5YL86_SOLCO|nr:hypothetical protein H5410_031873 [Solanum commersonii]
MSSGGDANPRQYYPNYRRSVGASATLQPLPLRRYEDLPLQVIRRARPSSAGTPSPTGTSPQLSAMRLGDSSSEQSDAIADYVYLEVEEKELGRTPIEPENDFHKYVAENLDSSIQLTLELSTHIWKEKVVEGTHKGRCYGLGSRNYVRRLQSGLKGIGSSRQAEALNGVQNAAMSDQIGKLTVALAESERKRVVEQESMSKTVQQIKEQVMNLAR